MIFIYFPRWEHVSVKREIFRLYLLKAVDFIFVSLQASLLGSFV